MPAITRFAPSPTGWLHLGHAYAAHWAWQRARSAGGKFFVRMEDGDAGRVRQEYVAAILDDLRWLGLDWDGPVLCQSTRQSAYDSALAALSARGLLYPCFCTRKEIHDEIARMGGAPHGPDGPLYPGNCRHLSAAERADRLQAGENPAWRLDTSAAIRQAGPLVWFDRRHGQQQARPDLLGDVILARKDSACSYHLAVVVDDAWQEIALVTRGEDLLPATHMHRLLQAILDLPVPEWEHHPLVRDAHGRRLAKRDNDRALRTLRDQGWSPEQVLARSLADCSHSSEGEPDANVDFLC